MCENHLWVPRFLTLRDWFSRPGARPRNFYFSQAPRWHCGPPGPLCEQSILSQYFSLAPALKSASIAVSSLRLYVESVNVWSDTSSYPIFISLLAKDLANLMFMDSLEFTCVTLHLWSSLCYLAQWGMVLSILQINKWSLRWWLTHVQRVVYGLWARPLEAKSFCLFISP